MERICAWCNKSMGQKDGPSDVVTHGMCDDCLCNMMIGCRVHVCDLGLNGTVTGSKDIRGSRRLVVQVDGMSREIYRPVNLLSLEPPELDDKEATDV